MNLRTFIATLAGMVTLFLLGWLVFGILLMDFYQANTTHYEGLMNEMPNLFLIIVSQLLFSFMLAYIFQVWAGFNSFAKGFTGGLFIGFFVTFAFDLYFLSGMNLFTVKSIIVDIIANTILYGIAGGVIGLVLGFGGKKTV